MVNSVTMQKALYLILEHEGGYVNDPNDPGGETNYGISKRAYPDLDIKNLTKEQAKAIYTKDYYLKSRCEQLPVGLDVSVFDMSVNAGVKTACKLLQKLVCVPADGIIGPQTLKAVREYDGEIVTAYAKARINYYRKLDGWKHYASAWAFRTIVTCNVAMTERKRLGLV